MSNSVIEIEEATVSYREDIALRGVTLQVQKGEFVGVVGPNGAGKTTLLTVVNGLGRVIHGPARVLGHQVTSRNGHDLRKRIGYVAQVQNIDPRMPMSVRDVVMIGRYGLLGTLQRPSRHDWRAVDQALALVGMTHLAQRPIGHLSGGELQRVSIARCLAQEPEIFLLDEPTASLDWRAQSEILNLVKLIHESRQLTTLFVTHDLGALPVACDRVILMKDGLIWGEGSPHEVLTDENLSQLYEMPVWAVEKRRRETALA